MPPRCHRSGASRRTAQNTLGNEQGEYTGANSYRTQVRFCIAPRRDLPSHGPAMTDLGDGYVGPAAERAELSVCHGDIDRRTLAAGPAGVAATLWSVYVPLGTTGDVEFQSAIQP